MSSDFVSAERLMCALSNGDLNRISSQCFLHQTLLPLAVERGCWLMSTGIIIPPAYFIMQGKIYQSVVALDGKNTTSCFR
ncbi:hypothetical protein A8M44_23955 [Escherichia coli]|nr:hypothetical protein A8M44_23955 [Escherichia coli]